MPAEPPPVIPADVLSKDWDVCGRFDPPLRTSTLASGKPPAVGTEAYALAGTAARKGCDADEDSVFLVYHVRVAGPGKKNKNCLLVESVPLQDSACSVEGVRPSRWEVPPEHLLKMEVQVGMLIPGPGANIPTDWEEEAPAAEGTDDSEPDAAPPASQKAGAKGTGTKGPRAQKVKKSSVPIDAAGEALRLGVLADGAGVTEAHLAGYSKAQLLCLLLAINQPAANKAAAVPTLQAELLGAFARGARLAPAFAAPGADFCFESDGDNNDDPEVVPACMPACLPALACFHLSKRNLFC